MKFFRVFFLAQTIIWTLFGGMVLMDKQIIDHSIKLAVLITMSSFWGVVASWKYVWKTK